MELYLSCGEGLTLVVEMSERLSADDFLRRADEVRALLGNRPLENKVPDGDAGSGAASHSDDDSERLLNKYHSLRKEHEKRVRTSHLPIEKRIDQLELQNAHILSLIDLIADGEHLKR